MKKIALKNAARGTAFDYAGQSWILLENDDGRALCLSKDIIETRAFDEGNCNNFAVASSKEYLNGAYLDNLLEDVNGPNAFLTTELDLTTDDGLKDYGTCTVTIFLLTVDQLAELLAERKKLHIIDEENLRYNCDIIALEYAIGALRR